MTFFYISAIRKADNVEVAIKKIEKNERGRWGTIKGKKVPLEIELLYRAGRSGTNCKLKEDLLWLNNALTYSIVFTAIIKMHEWYEHSHSYSLVMERPQPAVDLFDYLDTFGRMSEGVARHIFRQVCSFGGLIQFLFSINIFFFSAGFGSKVIPR